MKKLILLAMMLGLTGCGDNNQSDNQSNTQVNTLQKTEAAPTVANYSLAAPRAMSAVAPLQGWSITQSIVMGASTLIDAIKDTKVSAALVTPNAKQVAEVLRGGAAGVALSIAVDQLLDAVDWVMDPANNRIVYKVQPEVNPNIPRYWVISDRFINPNAYGYATPQLACNAHLGKKVWATSPIVSSVKDEGINPNNPYISGCLLYKDDGSLFGSSSVSYEINPAYDPKKQPEEEFLSLETVAEQVISNAQVGNLDAQVATNIAAQNILNDEELAKPVVQKLEDNARDKDPKCKEYVDEIVNHVSDLKDRHYMMLTDPLKLYKYYRYVKNKNPNGDGTYEGHQQKYLAVQGQLKLVMAYADARQCRYDKVEASYWATNPPPKSPLYAQ